MTWNWRLLSESVHICGQGNNYCFRSKCLHQNCNGEKTNQEQFKVVQVIHLLLVLTKRWKWILDNKSGLIQNGVNKGRWMGVVIVQNHAWIVRCKTNQLLWIWSKSQCRRILSRPGRMSEVTVFVEGGWSFTCAGDLKLINSTLHLEGYMRWQLKCNFLSSHWALLEYNRRLKIKSMW